jgi:hypothetical protein
MPTFALVGTGNFLRPTETGNVLARPPDKRSDERGIYPLAERGQVLFLAPFPSKTERM